MAAMRKLLVTIYAVATAATVTCPVLKLPSRAPVMPSDELDRQNNIAPILAAAERLLSHVLGNQVRLGEVASLTERGRRNVVLRCSNLSGLREVVWVNPGTFGYDGTVRLPAACR